MENPMNKWMIWGAHPYYWTHMVYLPTWMVDFYGFHVGKYTSPMDPMDMEPSKNIITLFFSEKKIIWINQSSIFGWVPAAIFKGVL